MACTDFALKMFVCLVLVLLGRLGSVRDLMNSSNAAAKTSGNHSFGRSAAVGIYYFINRMINFWINMSQVLEAVVSQVGVVNSFTACLSWFSIVSFRVITKSFRRNWLLLFLLHQFSQSTDIRSSPAKTTVLQAKRISSPILCEGALCIIGNHSSPT